MTHREWLPDSSPRYCFVAFDHQELSISEETLSAKQDLR